jgi:hypothetical protein
MPSSPDAAPEPPANEPPEPGLLSEFAAFLRRNKIWWLLPVVIVLALFVALAILAGTGTTPFIYTAE